jgi:hypothetical protein
VTWARLVSVVLAILFLMVLLTIVAVWPLEPG